MREIFDKDPRYDLIRDFWKVIILIVLAVFITITKINIYLWEKIVKVSSCPITVEWISLTLPISIFILSIFIKILCLYFTILIESISNIYINYSLYKESKNLDTDNIKYNIARLGNFRLHANYFVLFIKKYLLPSKFSRELLYSLTIIITIRVTYPNISEEIMGFISENLGNFPYKDVYTIIALSILFLGILIPAARIRGRVDSYRDNYKNSYIEIRKSAINIITISKKLDEYVNESIEYFSQYIKHLITESPCPKSNNLDKNHENFVRSIEELINLWDDNIMGLGLGPFFIVILRKEKIDISLISWIKSLQKIIPTEENFGEINFLYIKGIGDLDIGSCWMNAEGNILNKSIEEFNGQIRNFRYIYTHRICNLFYFNYLILEVYNISYRRDSIKYRLSNILNK